jgi:hypothetical protein
MAAAAQRRPWMAAAAQRRPWMLEISVSCRITDVGV